MPLTSLETGLLLRPCGNLRTAQPRELPTAGNDSGDLSLAERRCSTLERCGTVRSPCPFSAGGRRRGSPGNSWGRW
jgi:hypothetical protein